MSNNEQVSKPKGLDSKRNVYIAVALALVAVFMVVICLYAVQNRVVGNGLGPGTQLGILNTQEARDWIASCKAENPYIGHKCIDLFYYDYALKNNNEGICRLITDSEIRKICTVYFKMIN